MTLGTTQISVYQTPVAWHNHTLVQTDEGRAEGVLRGLITTFTDKNDGIIRDQNLLNRAKAISAETDLAQRYRDLIDLIRTSPHVSKVPDEQNEVEGSILLLKRRVITVECAETIRSGTSHLKIAALQKTMHADVSQKAYDGIVNVSNRYNRRARMDLQKKSCCVLV